MITHDDLDGFNKNGITPKMNWNNEYDNIANKCGYPYLFIEGNILANILKVRSLCDWIEENGIPIHNVNNSEYNLLRRFKNNKKKNKFHHKEYDEMFKKYDIYI